MSLPRNHPDGASADHEPPLVETDDPTPSLDGAGIAHLKCNKSHGGRIGSQRALKNRASQRGGKKTPFLSTPSDTDRKSTRLNSSH